MLGNSEEQGNLVCYSSWGHKESDMTSWLNSKNVPLTTLCVSFRFLPFSTCMHFGVPVAFRRLVSLTDLWFLLVSLWPQHFWRIDKAFCRLASSLSCLMFSCDLGRMLQGCSALLLYCGIYGASAQCHVCCPICWFGSLEAVIKCSIHPKGGMGVKRHPLGWGFILLFEFFWGEDLSPPPPLFHYLYQYWLMCSLCTLVIPSTTIFCSTDCFSFGHWTSFRWAFVCHWHTPSFVLWTLPSFLAPQGGCSRLTLDLSALALHTFFPEALGPFSGKWYLETWLE